MRPFHVPSRSPPFNYKILERVEQLGVQLPKALWVRQIAKLASVPA